MERSTRSPVVIGVDRTSESQTALRWGIEEAERRQLDARVVSVYTTSVAFQAPDDLALPPALEMREVLDEAVAYARYRLGDGRVSEAFVSGSAARVLLSEATDAALLVVGSRGRGTVQSVVMGSVSSAVAAHASCPVAVVRGADFDEPKPVLAGIDGSPQSELALQFAFAEADLRGVALDVAHCWQQIDYIDPGVWLETRVKDVRNRLREWMSNMVAELHQKYPKVEVREHLLEGSPGQELTAFAKDSGLVVAGSRGHGGIAGLLVGSVSQNLLHHSPCSVVVVR